MTQKIKELVKKVGASYEDYVDGDIQGTDFHFKEAELDEFVSILKSRNQQQVMDMVRFYGKDTWSDVWDCIESGLEPHELEEKKEKQTLSEIIKQEHETRNSRRQGF